MRVVCRGYIGMGSVDCLGVLLIGPPCHNLVKGDYRNLVDGLGLQGVVSH